MLLTFMPSQRETARKGLKARSVRIERNAGMSAAPTIMAPKFISESLIYGYFISFQYFRGVIRRFFNKFIFEMIFLLTITITKSSQHQAFVKYTAKPRANHLINISMKNITVNIRSM